MKITLVIVGVIILLYIFLIVVQYFAGRSFSEKIYNEARELIQQVDEEDTEVITEESLQNLPQPVQNYLKYAGIVGKEKIRFVRLKQSASIKLSPDSKGFSHTTEQYFTTKEPGFVWYANMSLFPGLSMRVRDKIINGKGEMLGKLFSLFTVVFAEGPKIDQGALARYVGEMVWFPSAFLSDFCTWDEIDNYSARLKVRISNSEVDGVFSFDDEYKIKMFECPRWKSNEDTEMSTYRNYYREYKNIDGIRVPVRGQAVWHKDGEDFIYWDGEITEIEYNTTELYD